ncbi:MAG: nuclear transport factor 2 family protein [Gemmatimonadaceae bacterium]
MLRLVEAFGKGDIPSLQVLIAEAAVWHVPGRSSIAGSYTGHSEIFGLFGKIMALSEGTFAVARQDTLASDTHGVNWDVATAQRDGASLTTPLALLARFRGGQIVEAWDLVFDQAAWDTFFQ